MDSHSWAIWLEEHVQSWGWKEKLHFFHKALQGKDMKRHKESQGLEIIGWNRQESCCKPGSKQLQGLKSNAIKQLLSSYFTQEDQVPISEEISVIPFEINSVTYTGFTVVEKSLPLHCDLTMEKMREARIFVGSFIGTIVWRNVRQA